MVAPDYTRTIDRATGKVQIDPNTKIPTTGIPALGLTLSGQWVPLLLNDDGTLVDSGQTSMFTPYFDDSIDDTDPGVEQTLIDEVVPDGMTRYLSSVILKTRVTGSFQILAGLEVIGSGRTGPGGAPTMNFNPMRPLSAGTEYKVNFTARTNSPVQSVEAYVQANDLTGG